MILSKKVMILSAALICFIFASSVFAESYLYVEERMAVVLKKIENGGVRGSITKGDYFKLKSRYQIVKHKSDRYKKNGTTETQYLQLERELTALEKDTERLLNSLKRR
jgi:uncharacterized protein YcgL (UPF0745 family)